ncbi:unnamed protein product [Hermetia illucens]|uniref:Farnesoic acid O-methyl transferase domain-containing protein n=1 Tax=Hermetia illucens TaxID=343691 RepID=A0A7R8UHQ3_HERIL|nr:uncharacterized protein LOC119647735 [Hermetia illucens]CAD7080784.1 unnamed protein product [Hermetia illucens]
MIALEVICLAFLVNSVFGGITNARPPISFLKLATCQEYVTNSDPCEHFFPIDVFKNNKSSEYKLRLKFYVMGAVDANIKLSNGQDVEMVPYTIVVGGHNNTYSRIRNSAMHTTGLDSNITGILSPLWPTPIDVRLKHDGELSVAITGVGDPLLRANTPDLDVKSLCLNVWRSEGRWFYNCNEDDESISAVSPCQIELPVN